jgi:uncharacterized Zn finger protein (UPF0148 family)
MQRNRTMTRTMTEDTCERCGILLSDGDVICRRCRKEAEARRRVLRLVKERKRGMRYGVL